MEFSGYIPTIPTMACPGVKRRKMLKKTSVLDLRYYFRIQLVPTLFATLSTAHRYMNSKKNLRSINRFEVQRRKAGSGKDLLHRETMWCRGAWYARTSTSVFPILRQLVHVVDGDGVPSRLALFLKLVVAVENPSYAAVASGRHCCFPMIQ